MWTELIEYEEYHKLQLSTVVRYQHSNKLCKYRLIIVIEKYRDIIFFYIAHP